MRRFHEWYMKVSKEGTAMFSVLFRHSDFFRGDGVMYVNFEDIYDVYHNDALDLSLISSWVL